jgi:hypothetical protein
VERLFDDLIFACLQLLHAQHVRALSVEPVEKAFPCGAAQTVRIEGDDSQEKRAAGKSKAI